MKKIEPKMTKKAIKLLEKVIIWTTKTIVYLITIIALQIIKIRYKVR